MACRSRHARLRARFPYRLATGINRRIRAPHCGGRPGLPLPRQLHQNSDGVFGSPRIREDLRYDAETCSLNRVARLMQSNAIVGIPARKQWRKRKSGLFSVCREQQVADGHYLRSHRRRLVVPRSRSGSVSWPGCGLVDESSDGDTARDTGGIDGALAEEESCSCDPAFRSWFAIYQPPVSMFPEGPQHHVQHECCGKLLRQRGCRDLFWCAQA